MKGDSLVKAITGVTNKWAKTRKAEIRETSKRYHRASRLYQYRDYTYVKEAVFEHMEEAIGQASGGGKVQFPARNLFYAMRALVQQADTTRPLTATYFDNLINEYEEEYGDIAGMYRDPRGVLLEPHTTKTVPLGTREVGSYELPELLYDKLLYVEKKGFAPIFQAYNIPAKYDLAIASSEGYAVKAAKELLARAEGCNITVLCLHDADPWGYNICRKLEDAMIDVIDLGLHLEEALEMGLLPEHFSPRRIPYGSGWNGQNQRVELNALAADPDQFMKWLEQKLEEHGLKKKLIPDKDAIIKHAEETRDKRLTDAIEDHVKEMIDLDGITAELVDQFKEKIKLGKVPSNVTKWGEKLEAKPWRDYVNDLVGKRVNKIDEEIDEVVGNALSKAISARDGNTEGNS